MDKFLLDLFNSEIKYYDDLLTDALDDESVADSEEDKKEAIATAKWAKWNRDRAEKEKEALLRGDKKRVDYDSLEFVAGKITEDCEKREVEAGMVGPTMFDDYQADLYETGITAGSEFYSTPYEVKTMSRKFNYKYQTTIAGRNSRCRYCESASTIEEMEVDRTPMPDFLKGGIPIHVINDTDYYGGTENAKKNKALEGKWGLIFVMEGKILIYSPKAVKRAILGYIWIKVYHSKWNQKVQWERKAVIDLSAYSRKIECDVPDDFLERKVDL